MDYYKIIKEKVKCCACEKTLSQEIYFNVVTLDRIAKWRMPTIGNVFLTSDPLQAISIVCDCCFIAEQGGKPVVKYAIEWNENADSVTYHLVEDLDPLPVIVLLKHDQLINLGGGDLVLKKVFAAFCDQD